MLGMMEVFLVIVVLAALLISSAFVIRENSKGYDLPVDESYSEALDDEAISDAISERFVLINVAFCILIIGAIFGFVVAGR